MFFTVSYEKVNCLKKYLNRHKHVLSEIYYTFIESRHGKKFDVQNKDKIQLNLCSKIILNKTPLKLRLLYNVFYAYK